jgi:RNA recognition motif-containing protein
MTEEHFVQKLFPQLGLVPSYAFNYHCKTGAFCGLAFANFKEAGHARKVVEVLNNHQSKRRRLRVKLKKKLPAEEQERWRLVRQVHNPMAATEGPVQLSGFASLGFDLLPPPSWYYASPSALGVR